MFLLEDDGGDDEYETDRLRDVVISLNWLYFNWWAIQRGWKESWVIEAGEFWLTLHILVLYFLFVTSILAKAVCFSLTYLLLIFVAFLSADPTSSARNLVSWNISFRIKSPNSHLYVTSNTILWILLDERKHFCFVLFMFFSVAFLCFFSELCSLHHWKWKRYFVRCVEVPGQALRRSVCVCLCVLAISLKDTLTCL